MDVQAVDLELLDLEVSDNRSPDRKPANGQGAEGTGTNGRCADHGCAKASRSKLHRGPLLPAGTEPGTGPREGSAVIHDVFLLCPRLARTARLTRWSSPGGTDCHCRARRTSRREVSVGSELGADSLGDPMMRMLLLVGSLERPGLGSCRRTAQ
jgi:hypothetical protein